MRWIDHDVVSALRRSCSPAKAGRHTKAGHYVLMAAVACVLVSACSKKEEEEEGPVVTVDVAPVLSSQISRVVRAPAVLYPQQQAAIVPKITAPIKKIYVEKGDKVKAGQILLELENSDLASAAGLRTDASGRVLTASGMPLKGLYAVGTDAASIFRGTYPGPGTMIGPALVFGWRAAMDAAGRLDEEPGSARRN